MWLSLVERSVRDREVVGSNPAIPTIDLKRRAACAARRSRFEEVEMLERFLHWLGLGLCHQLPERSFFGGGLQLPVCSRDTGIYLGFLLGFLLLWVLHRSLRPTRFPAPHVWVVMAVYVAAMAWDGVSSYAGLRVTNNALRLLTGLGVGVSAATVIYPMLQDALWRSAGRARLLSPGWRFAAWVALVPVSFVAIWWGGPLLGVGYPLLTAVAIIFTIAAIDLVIVGMFPLFDRKAERFVDLIPPIVVATILAIAMIAGAAWLRVALDALA